MAINLTSLLNLENSQAQSDLLRYYKLLIQETPLKLSFYHIHGHFDEILDLDISELTLEEIVNMECNVTADKVLVHGVEGRAHW